MTVILLLYAATLFVGATLLFAVQPMVGKMILPLLGGTPAVWSTCMAFFQAALLGGYAYAHATTAWLGPTSTSASLARSAPIAVALASGRWPARLSIALGLPAWCAAYGAGHRTRRVKALSAAAD
jgi:hypothetical protein